MDQEKTPYDKAVQFYTKLLHWLLDLAGPDPGLEDRILQSILQRLSHPQDGR